MAAKKIEITADNNFNLNIKERALNKLANLPADTLQKLEFLATSANGQELLNDNWELLKSML